MTYIMTCVYRAGSLYKSIALLIYVIIRKEMTMVHIAQSAYTSLIVMHDLDISELSVF